MCRRAGVLVGHAPRPVGHLRRESLVVELYRHFDYSRQALRECTRVARLATFLARQRQRQADDDLPGPALADERRETSQPAAGIRALDRLERSHELARRIADRDATARGA